MNRLTRRPALIALGLSSALGAQTAQLIADINATPAPRSERLFGSFEHYLECGSYLIGRSSRNGTNREFWRVQPNSGAIDLAVRLPVRSVSGSGCVDFGAGPRLWIRSQDRLWLSDTTPNGTYVALSGLFLAVETVGDSLFVVQLENDQRVLRRFDGSNSHLLARIPQSQRIGGYVTLSSGLTYFVVGDGQELWKTDGTAAGTQLVVRQPGSWIVALEALGNRLLMTAKGANGSELWISDGTASGTRELVDIRPGPEGSEPQIWSGIQVGNELVFAADDGVVGRELWATDGTANGTRRLADIGPGDSDPWQFALSAKGLVFRANDPNNFPLDRIYSFDGTTVRPLGPSVRARRQIESIGGGKVAFTSDLDDELFITDGSVNGTIRLDLVPGAIDSQPQWLTPLAGGGVVFEAAQPQGDRVIWRSDGTAASTRVLADFSPGMTTLDSNPLLAAVDPGVDADALFFGAASAQGPGVYRLRGGRVVRLLDATLRPQNGSTEVVRNGRALRLFSARNASGTSVWASDGSPVGTKAIAPVVGSQWTSLGDRAVFVGADRLGSEPWVSDGTAAGTRILRDIVPGLRSSAPRDLTRLGDRIVFVASDDAGTFLWITDGATTGTRKITSSLPQRFLGPRALTRVGRHVYFFLENKVWRTDGTAAGTVEIASPAVRTTPQVAFALRGALYFVGLGTNSGRAEIWRSNGLGANRVGFAQSITSIQQAVVSGNRVYCLSNQSQLAVFDSLTRQIHLIAPDLQAPADLLPAGNGGLYFTASSSSAGREVYFTDGSSPGTRLVAELRAGYADSLALGMRFVGDDLVFVGSSIAHGRELFRVAGPAKAHVASAGLGCGPLAQRILAADDPALGSIAAIRGTWPASVAGGIVLLGLPTQNPIALPNAAGCAARFDANAPAVLLGALSARQWSIGLPIPNLAGLNGRSVIVQGFAVLPRVIGSNALRLVVGQR